MTAFTPDQLWHYALAAIPMTIIVAVVCRYLPCRPSTRHSLWLSVLVLLVVAPLLPQAPAADLTRVDATISAIVDGSGAYSGSSAASAYGSDSGRSEGRPDGPGAQTPETKPGGLIADSPASLDRVIVGGVDTAISPSPYAEQGSQTHSGRHSYKQASAKPEPARGSFSNTPIPVDMAAISLGDPAVKHEPSENSAMVDGRDSPLSRTSIQTPSEALVMIAAGDDQRIEVISAADEGEISPDPSAGLGISSAEDLPTQWLTLLRAVRDAVTSLPPIPVQVWIGGAALLALISFLRVAQLHRLANSSTPAPHAVESVVHEVALEMGLPQQPITFMTDKQISPMVWSGFRAYLLLPRDLWEELDDLGRSAVISHELAHLKRRDHWVCWIEMLVGCIYWWHPVVWWVRKRLREEADLCCDAWVTSLMPTARSAYARALLRTKTMSNNSPQTAPAFGLGGSRLQTKRFARRLTMVMTQHITPKRTLTGIALACTVTTAGWLVTPTLAGPPTAKSAPACPTAPTASVPAGIAEVPPETQVPPAPSTALRSTFERYMSDHTEMDEESVDARLDQIEERLNMLMEQLGQWTSGIEFEVPEIDFEAFEELPEAATLAIRSYGEALQPLVYGAGGGTWRASSASSTRRSRSRTCR